MEITLELRDFERPLDDQHIGIIVIKETDISKELSDKIFKKLGEALDGYDVGFSFATDKN